MRQRALCFALPLVVLWMAGGLAATASAGQEAGGTATPREEIETFVLEPARLVETLDLKAGLVPQASELVAYEGEVYGGTLEVVRALDGGVVEKGAVLVQFDEEDVREQLLAAERDLRIARLKHAIAEQDLESKEAQHKLKLEQLEQRLARSQEALQRFLDIDKPQRIAQSAHNLEGAENRLQDQTEELEQLEKMYKEDDLTEETEEIVLRRTRRNLVRSRKSMAWQRLRHQKLLEVTIPHDEENARMDVRQKQLDLASYRKTAPLRLDIAKTEFQKSVKALEDKAKRYDDLRGDLDRLRVRAPSAGFAVRGAFRGGKWNDLDALRQALVPEGKVKAKQTLFTIFHPGNVELVASVGEADLPKLHVGDEATVESALLPGRTLPATVAEVAPVGVGGKHRVLLRLKETDPVLMPGQSAKAVVTWRKENAALMVPASAVVTKDGASHVYVVEEGATKRCDVETGTTQGDRVEITSGLEAGATVVVKPEK